MGPLRMDLDRRAGWPWWRGRWRQRPGERWQMDVDSSWCSRKPARLPQGTGDTPVFMGSISPSTWRLA